VNPAVIDPWFDAHSTPFADRLVAGFAFTDLEVAEKGSVVVAVGALLELAAACADDSGPASMRPYDFAGHGASDLNLS
jgi:hypothetical protein